MNRIEEMRERAGLSRRVLAQRIGTTDQTIGRLENGDMRLSQKWLERLSEGIGCSIADLLVSGISSVSDVVPVATPPRRARIGIRNYIVQTEVLLSAGIEAGATIAIDQTPAAIAGRRAGDILVVRVDTSSEAGQGASVLLLRQFLPPSLLTTNRSGPFNATLSLSDRTIPSDIVGILVA